MEEVSKRRLAYQIGDRLPRLLRYIYYILLTVTVVYWLYRLIEGLLELVRSIGYGVFELISRIGKKIWSKDFYYAVVVCLIIVFVALVIIGQYVYDLDLFGAAYEWFLEQSENLRLWFVDLIGV